MRQVLSISRSDCFLIRNKYTNSTLFDSQLINEDNSLYVLIPERDYINYHIISSMMPHVGRQKCYKK